MPEPLRRIRRNMAIVNERPGIHKMTSEIYHSLFAINQATEQIIEQLERFATLRLIEPAIADIRAAHFQELRFCTNHEVCAALSMSARDDAFRFQELHVAREERLNPASFRSGPPAAPEPEQNPDPEPSTKP